MTTAEKVAMNKDKARAAKADRRGGSFWRCRLRGLREKLGLTLRDVERATGIANATVSNAEHGYDVTLDTARKLADFFGATVEALWPERVKK